jgi:glutamine synthetase
VICDVYTPRGEPFAGDPRRVLRRQVERAKALGYVVNTGPELEFFLFRRGDDGAIEPLPHDQAGYFDFSTDLAQEIRQDMVDALEAFGIRVEAAHHEVAEGQHEIDFEYSDALRTADNAITFKFALKAIAQQHGLYATFMPKPIHGINGSGMHTHQSLWSISEQRNAFADAANPYGLSSVARSYMAGILAHARGMIAVLAPLVNSYKRLVPGYEAPTYLTWGRTNRSALIRVPMVSPGKSIEGTRAEVRCPDPSSNTYLAFAAMIAAGLDGVEKGLQLADPVEESLFEMDAATIAAKGIRELPGTLGEALDELEADPVIREALGDHVFGHYLAAKRTEWDEYRTHVSDWEVDRYLDQY